MKVSKKKKYLILKKEALPETEPLLQATLDIPAKRRCTYYRLSNR